MLAISMEAVLRAVPRRTVPEDVFDKPIATYHHQSELVHTSSNRLPEEWRLVESVRTEGVHVDTAHCGDRNSVKLGKIRAAARRPD
jgi:hypothetical protein